MDSGGNKAERFEEAKRSELQEAFQFLEQVKLELSDQHAVYQEFLLVMKGHATDAKAAIERVKSLFGGNVKLIEGFNKFLPTEHKIKTEAVVDTEDPKRDSNDSFSDSPGTLPSTVFLREGVPTSSTVGIRPALGATLAPPALNPIDVSSSNPNYARAVEYVSKIKHRFKPQSPDIFIGFIHLLRAHHQGIVPANEVVVKVAHLFAGHFDLQEEFVSFLPVDAQLQAWQTFQKGVGSVEHTQAAANSTSNSQKAITTTTTSSAGKSRTLKRKAALLDDASPGGKKG